MRDAGPITIDMIVKDPDATSGTWVLGASSSSLYAVQFYNSSNGNGNYFDVKFVCPVTGTYSVHCNAVKHSSAPILRLYYEGNSQGTVDLYAAVTNYIYIAAFNSISMVKGSRTLRFKCDGKNDGSGGYTFITEFITIKREA